MEERLLTAKREDSGVAGFIPRALWVETVINCRKLSETCLKSESLKSAEHGPKMDG